jgi:hypothetical protein
MEVEGGVGATAQPLRHILAVGQRGRESHNPIKQRPISGKYQNKSKLG